jgi:hypothetical protein
MWLVTMMMLLRPFFSVVGVDMISLNALAGDAGVVTKFSVSHPFADVGIVIFDSLLHNLVHIIPVAKGFQIGIFRGHIITQGPCQGVLFGFLDALDLVLPFPFSFFCKAFCACLVSVALCIPVQISSSLPSADGRHKRVTQVVLSVGGRLYIRPLEIATATPRALLADSREQVHLKFEFGPLARLAVEVGMEVEVEAMKMHETGFRFGFRLDKCLGWIKVWRLR